MLQFVACFFSFEGFEIFIRGVVRKKKVIFKYIHDFSIFQIFLKPAFCSQCGFVYSKILSRD